MRVRRREVIEEIALRNDAAVLVQVKVDDDGTSVVKYAQIAQKTGND